MRYRNAFKWTLISLCLTVFVLIVGIVSTVSCGPPPETTPLQAESATTCIMETVGLLGGRSAAYYIHCGRAECVAIVEGENVEISCK